MMDKRDYVIIGLLIVIIAMLSYGVINAYNDSQPVVRDFSDYIVTIPAGCHYHNDNQGVKIYMHENDSMPIFGVRLSDSSEITIEDFDTMRNSYSNGVISKSEVINSLNEDYDDNSSVLDFNVGDFNGEPEMSYITQNPNNASQKYLVHLIKHNNEKIFYVVTGMDNTNADQMYNTLLLK